MPVTKDEIKAIGEAIGAQLGAALATNLNKPSTKNYAQAPDHYDGVRLHYDNFRRNLLLHLSAIRTDRDKITAAISFYTKGDADSFAQNYMQANAKLVEAGHIKFDDFLAESDKKFLDPLVSERAGAELLRITQRDLDADVFFLKVDDLRVKSRLVNAEHHDKLVVETLRKHMNPQLVLAITQAFDGQRENGKFVVNALFRAKKIDQADLERELAELEKPISYDRFRELAIELDPDVRRYSRPAPQPGRHANAERRERAPALYQPYQPSVAPSVTPVVPVVATTRAREPDVVPMDVDRTRMRGARGPCYRCGKPGHIARECREPHKEVVRQVLLSLTDDDIRALQARKETRAITAIAEPKPDVNEDAEQDFTSPQ